MPEIHDPNTPVDVSVVIPTYNEEAALGQVIADVRAALNTTAYGYEIVIVDDCSTDGTAAVAQSLNARVIEER